MTIQRMEHVGYSYRLCYVRGHNEMILDVLSLQGNKPKITAGFAARLGPSGDDLGLAVAPRAISPRSRLKT